MKKTIDWPTNQDTGILNIDLYVVMHISLITNEMAQYMKT